MTLERGKADPALIERPPHPLAGPRRVGRDLGLLYAANGLIGLIFAATGPVAVILAVAASTTAAAQRRMVICRCN